MRRAECNDKNPSRRTGVAWEKKRCENGAQERE